MCEMLEKRCSRGNFKKVYYVWTSSLVHIHDISEKDLNHFQCFEDYLTGGSFVRDH